MADKAPAATVVKAGADDAKWYWLGEGRSSNGYIREVDFAANSSGVDPLFESIKIIDCDAHFTEPADLWTANVPAGCCQSNRNQSPVGAAIAWAVRDQIMRDCHSARAAERWAL